MKSKDPKQTRKLPRQVWMLGWVSLFMDTSSELIHALLPALYVTLGINPAIIGVIEGIAEATASLIKVVSGRLSDRLGKRKLLALAGYGLAALSKPLFALATTATPLFAARIIDRIGKGIRGAPRDALIADVTPPALRGSAYGLRQALDTVGAIFGPAAALFLMWALHDNIRSVLWFATLPAVLCVLVLLYGVKEPRVPKPRNKTKAANFQSDLRLLNKGFWQVALAGGLFALARFSEAFLTLKFIDQGLPLAFSPIILLGMSAVYAAAAWPAGKLSDHIPRRHVLALGLLCLIAADVLIGFSTSYVFGFVGIALWGLHMGLTQGVFSAMIATRAPDHLRGTAFGVFNLISGLGALAASLIAGLLWHRYGPATTFIASAILAGLSLLSLIRLKPSR